MKKLVHIGVVVFATVVLFGTGCSKNNEQQVNQVNQAGFSSGSGQALLSVPQGAKLVTVEYTDTISAEEREGVRNALRVEGCILRPGAMTDDFEFDGSGSSRLSLPASPGVSRVLYFKSDGERHDIINGKVLR